MKYIFKFIVNIFIVISIYNLIFLKWFLMVVWEFKINPQYSLTDEFRTRTIHDHLKLDNIKECLL